MAFLSEMDPATGHVDGEAVRDKGKELNAAYTAASPFPHIVIDDFLPPALLERSLAEFDRPQRTEQIMYDREQERLKREYKPDELSPEGRNLFYSFNSRPFVRVMENITGIRGLIPDPYFLGGGFHEIQQGGHLSIHADFNHHRMMDVERRINVLIYLNKDWKPEFGGQLELWDDDMTHSVVSIVPEFNRCVIFNTTSESNHGNPHPINHPDGRSRKSIALYYYTATWDADRRSHTTQFRQRQGTTDKMDWVVKRQELVEDLVPPFVRRNYVRGRRALARVLRRSA